jgi:hypothetical protein
MNRNSQRIIMGFSLVIQLIGFYLLFILKTSDDGFLPTCLSIGFSSIVFVFSVITYKKALEEEGKQITVKWGLLGYFLIILVLIIVKLIIQ